MILNEATQDLLNVINRINDNHEPLVVTCKHYQPVVIMNLEDFNAWQKATYRTKTNAKNLRETVKIRKPTARRKPSAKIAGKGQILGDIVTPVVATDDWSALA
ncbi:conserved hypothetical protein [Beggiatoa sp. PS]|nr:conserved hypothetical protein [Beggiatoa sp. PS]